MRKTLTSGVLRSKLLVTVCFCIYGLFVSAQPANDDPCNAIVLTPIAWNATCTAGDYVTTDNIGATDSGITAPTCGSYGNNDVWFTVTMPPNGFHVEIEFNSVGVTPEYGYEVFTGSACNSMTSIDCQVSSGGSNLIIEDGCNFQYAGAQMWVRFWDEDGETGSIDVCAKYAIPNFNPSLGMCSPNPPIGDSCCDAILLTDDLDGFCGNTTNYTAGPDILAPPVFFAVIENNSWLAFTAAEDSIVIGIEASSCVMGGGLQALIVSTNDCNSYTSISNFWNPATPTYGTLTATGLTPGENYYMMIDGWFGDDCDYVLSYVYGTEQIEAPTPSYDICDGQSVQLELETPGIGPYNFSWTPAGTLDDPTLQNPTATPSDTTTYTVHVTGITDTMIDVTVNVLATGPTNVVISGQNTVCENSMGYVYSATGMDINTYSWSVTGGTIVGPTNGSSVTIDWGTSNGSVDLVVFGGCGSTMESLPVNVIPPPNMTVQTPAIQCAPGTFDLTTLNVTTGGTAGGINYYANQTDAENDTNRFTTFIVSTSGTYWLRMEAVPGCYDVTSVDVTFETPQIVVDAVQATCQPFTINLDAVGITETSGASAMVSRTYFNSLTDAQGNVNALTDPNVGQTGTYYVRYETVTGCIAIEPIPITIRLRPDITITSSLEICAGGSLDLNSITFSDAAGTTIVEKLFFTSLVNAQIGIPGFAMSNTVVTTAGPFYMRLNTDEGCFLIEPITIVINPLPTANISVNATACYNETVDITFNLTGTGPFDVDYTVAGSPFSLTNITDGHITQHTLTADASFAVTTVTDNATTCSNTGGVASTIVVNPEVTAVLSGDNMICAGNNTDLTFTITGNPPFEITYDAGGTMVTESNILSSPHIISVSPTADIVYSLISVTDDLTCVGSTSGTATIQVGNQLSVTNFTETCNAAFTDYTISFVVTGGDAANYMVTGLAGSFSGNTFTSVEIVGGGSYNFSVSDGSACPSANFSGTFDCLCVSDPGTMDLNQITLCQGQLATANDAVGIMLDPGYIQLYFLHDNAGNSLGTVYGQNAIPEFTFVTGMTAGTIYYISSVVGPDNGVGGLVTTDPCYQVSVGTPIVFLERATADIDGNVTSCPGADVFIDLNIVGGVPPFDVTYTANGVSNSIFNVIDGDQIQVNPTQTTSYVLTAIVDRTSALCEGLASGTFEVTVPDSPVATNVQFICDGTNTNFQVVFELTGGDAASYVVSGDPGTLDPMTNIFTSDPLPTGSSYSFSYDDVNSCGPFLEDGVHVCDCDTDAGEMSAVLIEVCESANAVFSLISPVTLDFDDAHGYIMHNGVGNIPFTIYQSSPNPEFTFVPGMQYGTTYFVSSIVGDDDGSGFPVTDIALDPCLSISDAQPIVFYQEAVAGISGDATLCEGDIAAVLVNIDLNGDFNLVYNIGNGDQTEAGISNGEFINFNLPATTTINLVSIQGTEGPGCIGSIDPAADEVLININELPEASEPVITCDEDGAFFTVSFDITGGDAANYAVVGAGILTGNSFVSNPIPNETSYSFEITDGTGCPPVSVANTYVCLCTADITVDVLEQEGISCFENADGVIMASPQNGAAPFTFNWSTGDDGEMLTDVGPGMYKVSMTDDNGCIKEDSLEIFPPDPITPVLTTIPANCYDSADGEITISDIQGGVGEYTVEVGGLSGVGFPQTFELPGGFYEVSIYDENDCLHQTNAIVDFPPPFEVELGDDLVIEQGDEITLTAVSSGPFNTINWINVPDSSCTFCEYQTFIPAETGTFEVEVINDAGCRSTDLINVIVEKNRPTYIPNVFSPNGDGVNDKFSIFGGPSTKAILSVEVFSRWGELLFATNSQKLNDDTEGWDGRFKAKPMDEGVYIYVVKMLYIDDSEEVLSGDITLIR